MKLITSRSQILEVADRWKESYFLGGKWVYGKDKEDIYNNLAALDLKKATERDIEDIIGNNTWASKQGCNECDNSYDEVVQVGEKPDVESNTVELCKSCLEKALNLFV